MERGLRPAKNSVINLVEQAVLETHERRGAVSFDNCLSCEFAVYPPFFFFFNDTATTEIYTLSLHDALPIFLAAPLRLLRQPAQDRAGLPRGRSEEHTSELQSRRDLVCRLLLEKKNKTK